MRADESYWRRPEPDADPPERADQAQRADAERADQAQRADAERADQAQPAHSPHSSGRADPTGPAGRPRAYPGPPAMVRPPAGWRPDHIIEPPPPRSLPPQDHQRIDQDEARARTLTWGVGFVVGAIMFVMLCAVCARTLV